MATFSMDCPPLDEDKRARLTWADGDVSIGGGKLHYAQLDTFGIAT